jgi:hypothetical protein
MTTITSNFRIGIIGSCGKDGKKINLIGYRRMINLTSNLIKQHQQTNDQNVVLVSGGAALSDHIAIDLFLDGFVNSLILYLPCEWNESQCKFMENSKNESDPGSIANLLHVKFGNEVQKNTLRDIQMAIDKGAEVHIGNGFLSRNLQIANSVDKLIAFTFDKKMTPGTKHTWSHCRIEDKVHLLIK